MTVKRRKKHRRKLGSRTCGYGLSHRGAGERGGRGRAGTGKKAKSKMPVKGKWTIQYFGKTGFKSKGYPDMTAINIRQLEESLDNFVRDKAAVLDKGIYSVNLADLGIDKLLSAGKITKKFRITVNAASKAAVERIKAAGGEVALPAAEKEKAPETEETGKE